MEHARLRTLPLFGTLWAVIILWTAIAIVGSQDIAGPLFGVIFTVVIIATAIILNITLNLERVVSITSDRSSS